MRTELGRDRSDASPERDRPGAVIRLLGGVEVDAGTGTLDLGPAKQRAVLATLLLAGNRPVPVDELVTRIWDADAPAAARSALRAYICRLRAAVAPSDTLRVERCAPGYRVVHEPEHLDLLHFRRLVREAQRATDGAEALTRYGAALSLWRGEALAGVSSPWLDRQRECLDRERRAVELEHNDLALERGEHARILAALVDHAHDEPFDERIAGQLMLALHANGRSSEALSVYDRFRRRLRDELGTEPGGDLRGIHRRVLAGERSRPTPSRPTPSRATRPVPRQLPPSVARFVARAAQHRLLDAALGTATATDPRIAVLSGAGGAGKTALALRWAHEHAAEFPDGQLFVDLQGFDPQRPPLATDAALRAFALALGADPKALPTDPDELCGVYRTLCAERRILVVADNARDSAQVRALLPAGAGCATLITSRAPLAGIVTGHGAHLVDIGLLDADQARTLLGNRLGARRVDEEPQAVEALVQRCAGLPLALAIVAGRAAATSHLPLAVLADELADDTMALAGLHSGEPGGDVRSTLAVSLAALEPTTSVAFGRLGLCPGASFTPAGAAALTGLDRYATAAVLRELSAARLVEQAGAARFRMHDLVRLYAADVGRADPQAGVAVRRLLAHYLAAAVDPDAGRDFVAAESATLLAAVDLAFGERHDELGCDLSVAIEAQLGARGCWADVVRTNADAAAAATRLADPRRLVATQVALGRGFIGIRDFHAANAQLDRALELARLLGEPAHLAQAHRARARLAAHQHHPAVALRHDRKALECDLAAGDRIGEATAYNAVGWHLAHLERPARALVHCRRALTIFAELADLGGQAMTLDSIGLALELLGRDDEASEHYQRSADLDLELGWHVARAETLTRLERSYLRCGERAAARRTRLAADETLRRTGRLAA